MFDHIGLKVSRLDASLRFYEAALGALGQRVESRGEGYAGLGPAGAPGLWLYQHDAPLGPGTHVALQAKSRAEVQRFHAAGLAAGGRDHGPPGLRPDYAANYYAAFLLDPDGHNIEAVCYE